MSESLAAVPSSPIVEPVAANDQGGVIDFPQPKKVKPKPKKVPRIKLRVLPRQLPGATFVSHDDKKVPCYWDGSSDVLDLLPFTGSRLLTESDAAFARYACMNSNGTAKLVESVAHQLRRREALDSLYLVILGTRYGSHRSIRPDFFEMIWVTAGIVDLQRLRIGDQIKPNTRVIVFKNR